MAHSSEARATESAPNQEANEQARARWIAAGGILGPAIAAEQTVKLAVANMTCVSCVPIVRGALSAVPGVTEAVVSAQTASATVTFDDQKTTAEALIAAVTNAGYPTKVATTAPQ